MVSEHTPLAHEWGPLGTRATAGEEGGWRYRPPTKKSAAGTLEYPLNGMPNTQVDGIINALGEYAPRLETGRHGRVLTINAPGEHGLNRFLAKEVQPRLRPVLEAEKAAALETAKLALMEETADPSFRANPVPVDSTRIETLAEANEALRLQLETVAMDGHIGHAQAEEALALLNKRYADPGYAQYREQVGNVIRGYTHEGRTHGGRTREGRIPAVLTVDEVMALATDHSHPALKHADFGEHAGVLVQRAGLIEPELGLTQWAEQLPGLTGAYKQLLKTDGAERETLVREAAREESASRLADHEAGKLAAIEAEEARQAEEAVAREALKDKQAAAAIAAKRAEKEMAGGVGQNAERHATLMNGAEHVAPADRLVTKNNWREIFNDAVEEQREHFLSDYPELGKPFIPKGAPTALPYDTVTEEARIRMERYFATGGRTAEFPHTREGMQAWLEEVVAAQHGVLTGHDPAAVRRAQVHLQATLDGLPQRVLKDFSTLAQARKEALAHAKLGQLPRVEQVLAEVGAQGQHIHPIKLRIIKDLLHKGAESNPAQISDDALREMVHQLAALKHSQLAKLSAERMGDDLVKLSLSMQALGAMSAFPREGLPDMKIVARNLGTVGEVGHRELLDALKSRFPYGAREARLQQMERMLGEHFTANPGSALSYGNVMSVLCSENPELAFNADKAAPLWRAQHETREALFERMGATAKETVTNDMAQLAQASLTVEEQAAERVWQGYQAYRAVVGAPGAKDPADVKKAEDALWQVLGEKEREAQLLAEHPVLATEIPAPPKPPAPEIKSTPASEHAYSGGGGSSGGGSYGGYTAAVEKPADKAASVAQTAAMDAAEHAEGRFVSALRKLPPELAVVGMGAGVAFGLGMVGKGKAQKAAEFKNDAVNRHGPDAGAPPRFARVESVHSGTIAPGKALGLSTGPQGPAQGVSP